MVAWSCNVEPAHFIYIAASSAAGALEVAISYRGGIAPMCDPIRTAELDSFAGQHDDGALLGGVESGVQLYECVPGFAAFARANLPWGATLR